MTKVTRDALPYMVVDGTPARHRVVNEVAPNRHAVPEAERAAIRDALARLRRGETFDHDGAAVQHLLAIIAGRSPRSLPSIGRRNVNP